MVETQNALDEHDHPTPTDAAQGLVGGDLASGASGATGGLEQSIIGMSCHSFVAWCAAIVSSGSRRKRAALL